MNSEDLGDFIGMFHKYINTFKLFLKWAAQILTYMFIHAEFLNPTLFPAWLIDILMATLTKAL